MKHFKKIIFCLLVISGCFKNSFALPITPVPLRMLIAQSENIVIARVLKVEKKSTKDTAIYWKNSIATLLIQEVLKGSISSDTIKVYFNPGWTCPRSDSYIPHHTVLAFIKKHKEYNWYHTPALSYGTKYSSKEGLTLYKKRVLEMLQIMKMKPAAKKIQQTIDWLIECAKYPVTRWEATYEFYPSIGGNFMYAYDDDNDIAIKRYALSLAQKRKIKAILFSIQKMESFDIGLVDWAVEKGDQEMADFLIKKLKAIDYENDQFTLVYIRNIALVTDKKDLRELANKAIKLSDEIKRQEIAYEDYDQRINSIFKKFISLL